MFGEFCFWVKYKDDLVGLVGVFVGVWFDCEYGDIGMLLYEVYIDLVF